MDWLKSALEFATTADFWRLITVTITIVAVLLLANWRIRLITFRERAKAQADLEAKQTQAQDTFQNNMLSVVNKLVGINEKFSATVQGNTSALNVGLKEQHVQLEALTAVNKEQLTELKSVTTETTKTGDRVQHLTDETRKLNNDLLEMAPGLIEAYSKQVEAVLTEGRAMYRDSLGVQTNEIKTLAIELHDATRGEVLTEIKHEHDEVVEKIALIPDKLDPRFAEILTMLKRLEGEILKIAAPPAQVEADSVIAGPVGSVNPHAI